MSLRVSGIVPWIFFWILTVVSTPESLIGEKELGAALDSLMPLQVASHGSVRVRMRQDLHSDFPEFWFELYSKAPGLPVRAILRFPEGPSLWDQLEDRRRRNPTETLERLVPQLRVKQLRLESCAELKASPWDLPTVRRFPESITLHPMIVEIAFNLLDFTGSLRLTDDDQEPFQWAARVRRALEACAVRADSAAWFRTHGLWGLTRDRAQEIVRLLETHIPEEESFFISETSRADLDEDSELDLLYIYRRFLEPNGENPAQVFLGMIPGGGGDVRPIALGGPETQASLISVERRVLHVSLTVLDEWPPPSPDVESAARTARVVFEGGQFRLLP